MDDKIWIHVSREVLDKAIKVLEFLEYNKTVAQLEAAIAEADREEHGR